MICALPALWVGLIYEPQAQVEALDLISGWSQDDRDYLRTGGGGGVARWGGSCCALGGGERGLVFAFERVCWGGGEGGGLEQSCMQPCILCAWHTCSSTPVPGFTCANQTKSNRSFTAAAAAAAEVPKTGLNTPFKGGTVRDVALKVGVGVGVWRHRACFHSHPDASNVPCPS